jgi:Rieske Fe-S protein
MSMDLPPETPGPEPAKLPDTPAETTAGTTAGIAGEMAAAAPVPANVTGGRFTRRGFVMRALGGVGTVLAAAVGIPVAGMAVSPAFRSSLHWPFLAGAVPPTPRITEWQSLGSVDSFEVGVPKLLPVTVPIEIQGAIEPTQVAVYVVRPDADSVTILDIHCTHMGCPLGWSQGAKRFLCPCHGGAFSIDGSAQAGPPPRAMDRYQALVANQAVWMGPLVEPA